MRNLMPRKAHPRLQTAAFAEGGEPCPLEVLSQREFARALALERKRTERSHRRFVLMLLRTDRLLRARDQSREIILEVVSKATRETDIKGWYQDGSCFAVIFTEIGDGCARRTITALSDKVTNALRHALSTAQMNEMALTFYLYPEEIDREESFPASPELYPDLVPPTAGLKMGLGLKRAIDIAGSLAGLILCAPVFAIIAALVKLTSKGPVFFRQSRIGHYGKTFTFLKFRSMYVNNDHTIHKEYVTQLIAAKNGTAQAGQPVIYKLTADPRVTPIGSFLRRTSLDELPQFLNVLLGHMSLVGPRPPVPYEYRAYQSWHRLRLFAIKPGITGLWQVAGRSRVTFDEMVRLDLRYATQWSLWLDFKILLQTPRAVVFGQGAY